MAKWTREDGGLGIGPLVRALTLGSAAPHLLKAPGGREDWKLVPYPAASPAAAGGVISDGPPSSKPDRWA
jgi:hypothetical protein